MMDTQLNRQCLEILHARTVKEFVRISLDFILFASHAQAVAFDLCIPYA